MPAMSAPPVATYAPAAWAREGKSATGRAKTPTTRRPSSRVPMPAPRCAGAVVRPSPIRSPDRPRPIPSPGPAIATRGNHHSREPSSSLENIPTTLGARPGHQLHRFRTLDLSASARTFLAVNVGAVERGHGAHLGAEVGVEGKTHLLCREPPRR